MGRRKKSGGGGASWMDTYGDLVTLLLCFFVLLYSMSDINAEKFEILVKSFNPNAAEVSQVVINSKAEEGENPVDGGQPPNKTYDDFDELYYTLSEYIEQNNLENDIEVSKGDGFTFITFRNNIFFDGDSYVLKQQGKETLDVLVGALTNVTDEIKEISVLGHTSQASPDVPNEPVSDRFLSSNRATEVLLYLQQKGFIDPTKLVASGYGQFRPISQFDTAEGRAQNRRVEILITKTDSVERNLEEYYAESEVVRTDMILGRYEEATE